MSWETTKTWLIVVFVVLDLLLGYQYLQARQETQSYVESKTDIVANTKTLLAQHNFSLQAQIPDSHPDLPSLKAGTYQVSLTTLAKNVFPGTTNVSLDNKTKVAESATGTVKITQPGTWTVTYASPQSTSGPQDELRQVWKGEDYRLDPILTNDKKVWVFDQTFQGLPLFDAPLVVNRSQGTTVSYQQTLFQTPQPVGPAKSTISALDALNSLANTVDKSLERQDNVIVQIDLGYARKSPGSATSGAVSSHYWFPVWRIVTINTVYYVNAFTGEIETQQ